MAFCTRSALAAAAAPLLALALPACGDAPKEQAPPDVAWPDPTALPPPGPTPVQAPLPNRLTKEAVDLAIACVRYRDIQALIRQAETERTGLPPPPPTFSLSDWMSDCPPLEEVPWDQLVPQGSTGSTGSAQPGAQPRVPPNVQPDAPPETRLMQLRRAAQQSADDVVRLARAHPRVP